MATISSSGTWTALSHLGRDFGTSQMAKTNPNVPVDDYMNFESLKDANGRGVILPELQTFVQLAADGYAIGHWQAASLLFTLLKAYLNSSVAAVRDGSYPSAPV